MSVTSRKDKPDATAELKKELREVKAAGDSTAALLSLSFKAQIVADRAAGTMVISDEMILASAAVVDYPEFVDNHAYSVGEIIKADGLLFEVVAAHTSNAAAFPVATTFAYYRLVELAHTGAADDPIPYPEAAGVLVSVKSGLYYSYKGAIYKAAGDMPNCVYPPDTPGMWQWERVERG